MAIPWPQVFSEYLNLLKVALLDLLTLTRTGCAAPISFYNNLVITLAMFGVGCAVGFMALVLFDRRQRQAELRLHGAVTHAVQNMARAQRAVDAFTHGSTGPTQARAVEPTRSAGATQSAAGAWKLLRGQRAGAGTSLSVDTAHDDSTAAQRRRPSLLRRSVYALSEAPASLRRMRWGRVFKTMAMFWTLCYPGT